MVDRYIKYFLLISIITLVGTVLFLEPVIASGKKTKLECLAGNCGVNLKIKLADTDKNFSEEAPHVLCTLDTRTLKVDNSPTYRILVYETASNQNRIVSDTKIDFPRYKSNIRDHKVILHLIPKLGERDLYIGVHDSSGSLAALYRANISGSGSFTADTSLTSSSFVSGMSLLSDVNSTTATEIIPGYKCDNAGLNDCNIEALFFKKLIFEADRRRTANQTHVINESDNAYRVQVPVQLSKDRVKVSQPAVKFVIDKNEAILTVPESLSTPSLSTNTLRIGLNQDHADLTYKASKDELTVQVNDASPILTLNRSGSVGIKTAGSALSQLDIGSGTQAPLALRDSNLSVIPLNGAFEFTGNALYFTSGGIRRFILLDPSNPNAPGSATANVIGSLDANTLDGKLPSFFLDASNINTGTLSQARLPDDIGALYLNNEGVAKNLSLLGDDNVTLISHAANLDYTLPISGTLATTDDLLADNYVTTSHIVNGTIQGLDIAPNTLSDSKISNDLSADKVTSGVVDKNRLPNRDIANINNLGATLGNKILKTEIIDNSLTTNSTKPVSAKQGKELKNLIDLKTQLTTDNQVLAGSNLDFLVNHGSFLKTMSADTLFTASNLKQGHRILLELNGNFNVRFPDYFQTLSGAYDGTKVNFCEFEVINEDPVQRLVYVRIFN